jgi:hypothetical protein
MNIYYVAIGMANVNEKRKLESSGLNNGSSRREWAKLVGREEPLKLAEVKAEPEVVNGRRLNTWDIFVIDKPEEK